MISQFSSFDEFVKRAQKIGISSDLNALLTLNIIFYEEYEDYLILSLVDFDSQPNKILIVSETECLVYPEIINVKHSLFKAPEKARNGSFRESTVTTFLALKRVLGSYTAHYEKLNKRIEHVGDTLDLDEIEEIDRHLKKFSDVVHSFESLLIELEESTLKFVDAEVIGYDYDLLLAKTTHLTELCRGLKGELSIVRDKTEVRFSKELNKNIVRLTQVMAFLTIINIVLTVPNTVATMFGVSTLSAIAGLDIYMASMILTTLATIVIAFYYMKQWNV